MASRTLPTGAELTRFRAETEASMLDACRVLRRSATGQDAATGMPTATWVPQPEGPCDFTIRNRREVQGEAQILVTVTSLRLPLAVVVSHLDRIRLTRKLLMPMPVPETYDITDIKAGGLEWILELTRTAATLET